MSFNNVFACIFASFLVLDSTAFKACSIGCILVAFICLKFNKSGIEKRSDDIVVGLGIILLNNLININFEYINFYFLCVASIILYLRFPSFKMKTFFDLYLLLLMAKGVVWFCVNI